ncbi:hypothetical protein Palpr_2661 [Paludibacter propionicigenes WB4]|uniref:Uncharacterized protein n=1 Tax=Paludibacter propionicigenes (strain DSM 17365 / JCM 13257 / WB4) TaxID=694427 RepID=E4T7U7_PALPW|nr:hypothetical protein [Paludibacter propionicigenes]ADQ80791.1 hypothetical protein Palpr_2661 [Paludibacter propionicigenes WB4]
MIKFENHIIFDDIESWPSAMLDLIRENEDSLKGFLEEEHRIGKLAREDVELRYNRPENIYREKWDEIISEIETLLKQHSIIGIHCSKLLDWEIKDIENNGLKPLDRDFANRRIEKAVKEGALSKVLSDKLIDKKEFSESNRKGYVWVFHCLETLTFESGLNRLLGLWGGESLYAYIKDNQELKTIGTPCIVFTSIKISELDIYPELSKRMTAFYFDDNYFPHDTDSIIKTDLNVLKVVKRDEKIFEELTGIENWDNERY